MSNTVASNTGQPNLGHVDTTGPNLLAHLRQLAQEKHLSIKDFALPREHRIDAGRLHLHCLEWGDPLATPVVFAHAGRLNAHSWDLVCLALKANYRCIAFDLPGHGDSDRAPGMDYHLASCSEDLRGLADSLQLGKFFLVGASQGGLQSLAYALHHPDTLRGLVLSDSGPYLQTAGVARQGGEMAVYQPFERFQDIVQMSQKDGRGRNTDRLRFTLSQNTRQLPDGRWTWKFDTEYRTTKDAFTLATELQGLMVRAASLTCPVLVLHGEHSDILLADGAKHTSGCFPDGRWATVPATRHLLHHDNPNAFIDILQRFFASAAASINTDE